MRHGSLFSGILGPELAADAAGVKTAWCAEVDKFCNKVIGYRRPGLPNLGDVREINGRRIQPVDVVSLGFPCQDLSVAGRRAGLAGARSHLFFEAARIIDECHPAFALVENVPGLFSSNAGRDFHAVLSCLVELGARDIAWRVFDSQYWGVPQQRRRVYLVADFRGRRAAEILFEPTRCEGHPSPRSEMGQGVAGALTSGSSRAGVNPLGRRGDDYNLVAKPLGANDTGGFRFDLDHDTYVVETSPAVTSKWAKGTGGPAGHETQNLVYALRTAQTGANGIGVSDSVAHALDASGPEAVMLAHALTAEGADAGEDGTGRGTPLVWQTRFVRNGRGAPRDVAPSLLASEAGSRADFRPMTLGRGPIRRFTPVECERLQGFPDGWTCLCGAEGDIWACRCPDGPRYRALGNAWTTGPESPAAWIFGRMAVLL